VYLVLGYTNGERIVHHSNRHPDLGRWLERKHTPRFRTSAVSKIICHREMRLHRYKGRGVLPHPLKGADRLDTSVKRVQRLNDVAD